jgi:hypothetical protein
MMRKLLKTSSRKLATGEGLRKGNPVLLLRDITAMALNSNPVRDNHCRRRSPDYPVGRQIWRGELGSLIGVPEAKRRRTGAWAAVNQTRSPGGETEKTDPNRRRRGVPGEAAQQCPPQRWLHFASTGQFCWSGPSPRQPGGGERSKGIRLAHQTGFVLMISWLTLLVLLALPCAVASARLFASTNRGSTPSPGELAT